MSENVQEIIDELIQKYEEGELTLQDIDEADSICCSPACVRSGWGWL